MRHWYLLYTKHHKETQVNRLMQERDLETFFPFVEVKRGYGRGTRLEPFFPHYLFVHVDLTADEATDLRYMPGVRRIVEFGSQPAPVPESIIQALQTKFSEYAQEPLHPADIKFKAGDRVRVKSGPFQGLDAIFQEGLSGKDRVVILLDMLGTLRRANIDLDNIERRY